MSNKSTYEFAGAPFDAPEKENSINMPPEQSRKRDIVIDEVVIVYEVEPNSIQEDRLVSVARSNKITEIPVSKTADRDEGR